MRHKRAKVYKRAIGIYTQAFGFRQPFQILVSNDVILACNRESDLYKQLGACVQGDIKPMITQCCVEALYKLGTDHQHAVDVAKTFERRRCNHREAIPPDDCLNDMIGSTNKHRYVLAVQSQSLRAALSAIPGLPMVHFNPRGVLVLSPLSHATLKHKDAVEEERRVSGAMVLDGVVDGNNVVGGGDSSTRRTRPKVKAPNPLSQKKKKEPVKRPRAVAEEAEGEVAEEQTRKKKRKRRGKGVVAAAIEEIRGEVGEVEAD